METIQSIQTMPENVWAMVILFVLLTVLALVGFLKPSIKAVVSKGFAVATHSFPVVLVTFVFGFMFSLINLWMAPKAQAPDAQVLPLILVAGLVSVVVMIFMQAGSMGYVRDFIKQGQATLADFFNSAVKNYLRIFLLSILIGAIILGLVLLAGSIAALLGESMEVLAMVLAIVIAGVGIFTVILFLYAPYIAIADSKKVIQSMSESVVFVRKNILKIFGILLVVIWFALIVGVLLGLVLGLVGRAVPAGQSQVVFAFFSSFVNAFLGIFVTASLMSFYLSSQTSSEPIQ